MILGSAWHSEMYGYKLIVAAGSCLEVRESQERNKENAASTQRKTELMLS